ncbi:ribokinase [Mucilaginibacter robiniae]|uniref:Ribokinase n=2 Tax=Mucilaginibacter robiniae TaxID=2728022 RepID=A0A7L5E5N5_9SPHI|nr:ribokinase [Mucilaginibacter robiniae]
MYDICCIGHITLDKVVTPHSTIYMPGGTAYYFSKAISQMQVDYTLVTAVAITELTTVTELRQEGIAIKALPSTHSVFFENIYSHNQDHRTQRVLQKAAPFNIDQLADVQARYYHLGPLLADDIPLNLIEYLAHKGMIALDVQGYLREVRDQQVHAINWPDKKEALRLVTILKANEHELEVLTGCTDIREGAQLLADWGVKEVVITLGSMGSVIYAGGTFYDIPAYPPSAVVDATGCGDTYMAGYLYQRCTGAAIDQAGRFAAAMASLKIEASGPFTGTKKEVMQYLALQV